MIVPDKSREPRHSTAHHRHPQAGRRVPAEVPAPVPGARGLAGRGVLYGSPDDGRQGTGQRRPSATWTPWLLIPYNRPDPGSPSIVPDRGFRAIPSGEVFWLSPHIWVTSSDQYGNAVPDEPNFVHARIFNLGKAPAIPTRVEFYWGDPSMGLGPGKMNFIGEQWVEALAHRATAVRCPVPWIPTFLNGGHECLMAQCISPVLEDLKTGAIEPAYPLQPQLDRHVGQKNLTVLHAKPGQKIGFGVGVYNSFPLATTHQIAARIEHVGVAPAAFEALPRREIVSQVAAYDRTTSSGKQSQPSRPAEAPDGARNAGAVSEDRLPQDVVHAVPESSHSAGAAAQITATLSKHSSIIPSPGARAYLGELLLAADRAPSQGRRAEVSPDIEMGEVALKAFEQRRLDLDLGVPASARPGEFVVYHLVQSADGLTVGGYTVVVHITP